MLNMLAQQTRHLKILLNENSTTILTGVGVVGVAATAVLTGRATFKAAEIIAEEAAVDVDLTRTDKVKLVWKAYILPVGVGTLTITSVVLAHKISAKRIAALTLAAGISERTLKEYKEKVLEKFGDRKSTDVRDSIAQDRVNNNPANREVLSIGTGQVLCYDNYTGRYFSSTVEDIKRAENKLNYELINFGSASLTEFFDEIGLPATSYSDNAGWNVNTPIEVVFSTVMTPDNRPCIAIDFTNSPITDYSKHPYD